MNEGTPSFKAYLTDPQFIALFFVLGIVSGMLYFFGFQLIPFIIAFLFAYFLDSGVVQLVRRGMRRWQAIGIVFSAYLLVYLALLIGPLQLATRRALTAARGVGANADRLIQQFQELPDPFFGLLPENLRGDAVEFLVRNVQQWFTVLVTGSIGLLPQVTSWIVFLFLVPLLVFFFLKDKDLLARGILRCLPRRRELVTRIWLEMEQQIGNYVRGKVWEILIVGIVTWLVFILLGFEFPVVYGVLTGLSVLIPYVGALGVTIPLFIQGYLQWGMTWDLGWLLIAYSVIQFLDGNVLAPLIFSETVKLHPIVILLAVFIFGSLWGFWGVVLAIPLATFAKALLHAVLEFRERQDEARSAEAAS